MKYKYSNNLKGLPGILSEFDMENKLINIGYDCLDIYSKHMKTLFNTKREFINVDGYDNHKIKCIVIKPDKKDISDLCIIYFHGGGFYYEINPFVIKVASYLSSNLNCKVFIPEYRTSKEKKFPVPVEDCYHSTKYIYDNSEKLKINKNKIILYGESAGANFVTSVSIMNRDRHDFNICYQMLIYPALDYKLDSESAYRYTDLVWNRKKAKQAWQLYLGNQEVNNIGYASPIYEDNLSNLPDAYIEAHEIDCFFDDALKYADLLKKAKNNVILKIIKGSYHGVEVEFDNPFVQKLLENRCKVIKDISNK